MHITQTASRARLALQHISNLTFPALQARWVVLHPAAGIAPSAKLGQALRRLWAALGRVPA